MRNKSGREGGRAEALLSKAEISGTNGPQFCPSPKYRGGHIGFFRRRSTIWWRIRITPSSWFPRNTLFCSHLSSLYFFFPPLRVVPFLYGPFEKNIPSSPPRGYPPLSLFKVSFVSFFFSERRNRQRGKQNNPRGKEHSRYNGRNVTRSPFGGGLCLASVLLLLLHRHRGPEGGSDGRGGGRGREALSKTFLFFSSSFFRKALFSSLPHSLLLALRKFFALLIKTL